MGKGMGNLWMKRWRRLFDDTPTTSM
jgi:hypothetical protein